MNRFELLNKYNLTPYVQHNLKDKILYQYVNPNNVLFSLEHFTKTYSFSYKDICSDTFDNYEDEAMFDKNYREFISQLLNEFI